MAMRPEIQYSQIGCGFAVCTPSFRVLSTQQMSLIFPGSGMNATSAATITAQAAISLGAGITSDSFVPVQKADLSGAWSLAIAGPFAVPLMANLHGFDEVRFVVSSVANYIRTLALITKS